MSAKIEQILDVLTIVKQEYEPYSGQSLQQLRISATKEVAEKRHLWDTSVEDKYQRWLKPDIVRVEDFDRAVESWLTHGSSQLEEILFRHCKDSRDEQRVREFFESSPPYAISTPITEHQEQPPLYEQIQTLVRKAEIESDGSSPFDLEDSLDDRERVAREIVIRRGRSEFRVALLQAYGGQCAVTRTSISEVLEAAHIRPYKGEKSNHPANGLLLRADIHTLFDYGLLCVDGDTWRVLISDLLRDSEYAKLDGTTILLPEDTSAWPSREALNQHRNEARLA